MAAINKIVKNQELVHDATPILKPFAFSKPFTLSSDVRVAIKEKCNQCNNTKTQPDRYPKNVGFQPAMKITFLTGLIGLTGFKQSYI